MSIYFRNPVTFTKNGVTYYYHLNVHGDTIGLTDANGNLVATYEYDVWGNISGLLMNTMLGKISRGNWDQWHQLTHLAATGSGLGVIISTIILSGTGPGAVYTGAIGDAPGWIIGGTLSRKYMNNDLNFRVWIPLVKARTYTIY